LEDHAAFINPEEVGSTILQKVGNQPPRYTELRKQEFHVLSLVCNEG